MNLDSLSFTLSQISYLVANLSKKNYKSSTQEISQLVALHGLEADRHLLRCLFSHLDLSVEGVKNLSKDNLQIQLLSQECAALLTKPALISNICFAIDNPLHQQKTLKPSSQLLPYISKALRLSSIQEVTFGLALLHSSIADIVVVATQFLKQKLPDLIRAYINSDTANTTLPEGGLHDTTPEVLNLILRSLLGSGETLGVTPETKEVFLKNLRRDFPRELVPVVLAPLLYPFCADLPMDKLNQDSSNMANSMLDSTLADLVMEIGYGFCSSVEECRNHLVTLGAQNISAGGVARVLAMMTRSHTGLDNAYWAGTTDPTPPKEKPPEPPHPTSWTVDIFVQTLKELVPNLQWNDVVLELDHADFLVKDRQGLSLLFTALRLGLQGQGFHPDRFPVDLLYRHWKHADSQLSLFQQILKNPDVFCFADYPYHAVAIDILKTLPENDNKEILTWRSLDLVQTLLYLSERGLYTQVQELLKFPIQNCPDVLVLALLQISTPVNLFRQELLTNLMPIFLTNHPNSAIILHHAWHSQGPIKTIIMHAMAEWYLRGENDQSRLTRILEVAQDLKALSLLLNAQSFPFVIDLACLASRREYLKLEKWLTDKIREHGEPFISAVVKFLQRRCPSIMGGTMKEENIPKSAQLLPDTLTTILHCLQTCVASGSISQELSETILAMATNCSLLMNKPRHPPGVLRSHRGMEPAFTPFPTQPVDPLANLSSSLAGMGMGGPPSSSAFSLQGGLGPLVSTPGSPSRLMAPSQSPAPPYPMMALGGPVGTQIGPGPSLVGPSTMARMGQPTTSNIEKSRLGETVSLFPEMNQNVSKEIEDEANSYFQRIYNHPPHPTLSIDEVLEMLNKFKDSQNKREREVFSCMLRNLFEEYRFFPQYPDKELYITAQLFGGIIERGLVTNFVALGLALRFVLDALRKPSGSKMYFFGIAALDRFRTRLKDYQKYCEHVTGIAHFSEFPPHLIEYVEYGLQGQEPPNRPVGPVLPSMFTAVTTAYKTVSVTTATTTTTVAGAKVSTTNVSSRPISIANATNIDTLLVATEKDDKIIPPPEAMQDKVAFIFNNLSQLNLQTKCDELRETVTEEYWPWIAQYLVMKRASIELNFHVLYSNFLDVLKVPEVYDMVLIETYRNIRVLLRSDKGIANFSDRSLLKNLGHWLGMLTLGRKKPIRFLDLDLNSLLIEAYNKGQQELLYVVPFVAKVLESCSKNKAFRPRNPWTMSIMNLLGELHREPDLKLNLKFEIEVLCKNLSLDVADLKPGNQLKSPEALKRIEHQLSPPKPKTESAIAPPVVNTSQQVITSQGPVVSAEELTNMVAVSVSSTPAPVAVPTSPTPTPGLAGATPPEPRFSYSALNTSNISTIAPLITINGQIALFQAHPHLKQIVRPAIERAITEWIHPVVERSVKIAITTSDQIVKKDFALDPDESRMRAAAHHMVRNLTAGMAMITCRDQLLLSINSNLKTAFLSALLGATQQQKDLVDQAATITAQDNMELACAFIQKTAIEKATPEIDKHLLAEYERRKHARTEGRRYCDSAVLTYQAERMPEQIRLKVGAVTQQQMAVYEEFARNIPGFQPLSERDAAIFLPKPVSEPISVAPTFQNAPAPMLYNTNDELTLMFEKLAADLELVMQQIIASNQSGVLGPNNNNAVTNLPGLLDYLVMARRSRDPLPTVTLIQKVVECILDQSTQPGDPELVLRYREVLLRLLKCLQDPRLYGIKWVNNHITRYLTECREEFRYNLEGIDLLIRSQMVHIQQYDQQLGILMENGLNYIAMAFAMQLVQHYLVDDRNNSPVTDNDLYITVETLARILTNSRQPPDGLANLIEMVRVNHDQNVLGDRATQGPTAHIHSGILQVRARDFEDPPGLIEKTDFLLREWVNIYNSPTGSKDTSKAFSVFVHQMNCHGILKTDDYITRFFRLSIQMVVDLCYRLIPEVTQSGSTAIRNKVFHTIDAYVKLIALLVKHSGDSTNTSTKINLLNKVLGIVAGVLLQDHDGHQLEFQQLPYHRIFIMLFLELNVAEPILEAINYQILNAFSHTLHILRPTKCPGFAYAWLELVSHRLFLGRTLANTPQQKGWAAYAQLLVDLFKYLAPFLRNAELAKPVTLLYKGTLRVLLVLLHDFPEFLCDYHYGFCDVIPPNCIQMRNLILSAFPRNMRLPDPFTPNLKVDMLSEITHAPRVLTNYSSTIQPTTFRKDLDSYLKLRAPVTFLSELRSNLQVSNEPGMRYNIPLMNALVLYVGVQAINHIRNKGLTPNMTTIAHSSHMDIFQNLAVDLDTEGRYLFLNAIANQLRYPNSHTHYFSCTLLYLFAEANTEAIQEQITRVLLERLIVNRPHPWGLLITFIELIKNPTYKFWNHEFVHCAPEIEKLFESVARSCMVQKHVQVPAENELTELQNLTSQTAFSVA